MRPILVLLGLCAFSAVSAAQPSSDELIAWAREASAPYADLRTAIAAGYRKIGPDLPNMGEHWIRPRYAVRPAFDPHMPSVLTYLRVDGKPVLTGVAYTIGVEAGGHPPPPPVAGTEWHFHSGAIEEEVFGEMHHSHDGFRIGMLHAWVWTDNPDGVFTADNWGLSFQRLGLPIPEVVPPAASKALFLPEGGVDHYMRLIDSAVKLSPAVRARVLERFSAASDAARMLVEASTPGAPSSDELVSVWKDLWEHVQSELTSAEWSAVRVLAG